MRQGVYHVFNVAKMRIMEVLYMRYPNAVSTKEIALITGMEQNKVSRLMSHYHYHKYGYFRRMKKKDPDGSYRYKLNKKGLKVYLAFVSRVKDGFDLNLKRKVPVKMTTYNRLPNPLIRSEKNLILSPEELSPYIKLSNRGVQLGLKQEDALKIVGIIKESAKADTKADIEPIRSENPVTNNGDQVYYKQALKLIAEEIDRILEKLETTDDIEETNELRNRLNKCLGWHEDNKGILRFL